MNKEELEKELHQKQCQLRKIQQEIFYANEAIECLEFDISNIEKILNKSI